MTWSDVVGQGRLAVGYCRSGRWSGALLLTGPVGTVEGRRAWDLHTRLPDLDWEQEISVYFEDALPGDFLDTVWASDSGLARVAQESIFIQAWMVGRDPLPEQLRVWLSDLSAQEWLAWYEAN